MKAWNTLVTALAYREKGTSLALFRIFIALTICGELFTTWWSGAASFLWHPQADGGFKEVISSSHWLFSMLGGATTSTVDGVFSVALVASVMVLVGLGTQGFAAISLVTLQALFSLQLGSGGGHDRVMTLALFGLILAASDATLSLTCRLRTGQWTSDLHVPAWPRYVGIWQLTVIYVFSGSAKTSPHWLPLGEMDAVYRVLLTPIWSRGSWELYIEPFYRLTQLSSVVTMVWELTWFVVPLMLLWRASGRRWAFDPRPLYLGLGVVMHLVLWVATNLGPFSPITLSFYVLLYGPEEMREVVGRFAPAGWLGGRET